MAARFVVALAEVPALARLVAGAAFDVLEAGGFGVVVDFTAAALVAAPFLAGALVSVAVVFLVERAVVVAGAALDAADARRLRLPLAAALAVALVAVTFVARAVRLGPVVVARARAGALLAAAAFLTRAFLPAAFLALSAALKPAAGLKRMPFDAAILTGWPVLGLRPVRAFLDVALKLPKP